MIVDSSAVVAILNRESDAARLETLRRALEEGERSGIADYGYEAFLAELDEEVRQWAKPAIP